MFYFIIYCSIFFSLYWFNDIELIRVFLFFILINFSIFLLTKKTITHFWEHSTKKQHKSKSFKKE